MLFLYPLSIILLLQPALSLDNGLALTPPMGWLTWERYRCIIDCTERPDECISERLILRTAEKMVTEGYLEAGYEYLGIDDCWSEMERDKDGKLVPNKDRFPNGMKYIADNLHARGLKFGIYGDFGTKTCGGYPGSIDHLEIDAKTWAEWDVDYVKLDGCYVDLELMDSGYPKFGQFLNNTGRRILYSCSWPAYQEDAQMDVNYTSISHHCNMWRNWDDIEDNWQSVESIMKWFGDNSRKLAKFAGPGNWNDPDMLIIGNFGLSYEQSKVQMAVWAILGAPLLMSNDLYRVKHEFKQLLLNKKVLAVNQDILGIPGIRVIEKSKFSAWKREISPIVKDVPSLALAFVSHNIDGIPRKITFSFEELEIEGDNLYTVEDLLPSETQSWRVIDNKNITVTVNPTGVVFLKLTPHNKDAFVALQIKVWGTHMRIFTISDDCGLFDSLYGENLLPNIQIKARYHLQISKLQQI